MNETTEQYISRITGLTEGKDPLTVQKATPERLRKLVAGASEEQLKRRPQPEKWAVAEILAHLADSELVYAFRMRFVLGSNGAVIQAYDQDVWASSLQYQKRDSKKSLALFTTLRENNLEVLESLSPEKWQYYGLHQERGKESIERMVTMFAGHDLNHIHQIENILGKKS